MAGEPREPLKIDLSPIIEAFKPLHDALVASIPHVTAALAREMAFVMQNARLEREEHEARRSAVPSSKEPE